MDFAWCSNLSAYWASLHLPGYWGPSLYAFQLTNESDEPFTDFLVLVITGFSLPRPHLRHQHHSRTRLDSHIIPHGRSPHFLPPVDNRESNFGSYLRDDHPRRTSDADVLATGISVGVEGDPDCQLWGGDVRRNAGETNCYSGWTGFARCGQVLGCWIIVGIRELAEG